MIDGIRTQEVDELGAADPVGPDRIRTIRTTATADDDQGPLVGLEPASAGRAAPDPAVAPRASPPGPAQDRLAWLMQNRVAGMASSRAGLMATPHTSHVAVGAVVEPARWPRPPPPASP